LIAPLASLLWALGRQGLANVKDKGGQLGDQITVCNALINTMVARVGDIDFAAMTVDRQAQMLLAILETQNSATAVNEKVELVRPVTSIAVSSLFTGSVHEPSMFSDTLAASALSMGPFITSCSDAASSFAMSLLSTCS